MLVIFDCDGVLVDSELLAAEVFSATLAHHGLLLTPNQCYQNFRGFSLDYCFEWLEKHFEQALPQEFPSDLASATQHAFKTSLQVVPGVRRVLEKLSADQIAFCVASNGSHKKIETALRATDLLPFFQGCRFSADDVQRGKPAPDLFLRAAESMGVPINNCIVIEDSQAGITAAQAAGMRSLLYAPCNNDKQSDVAVPSSQERSQVFNDMNQLLDLL